MTKGNINWLMIFALNHWACPSELRDTYLNFNLKNSEDFHLTFFSHKFFGIGLANSNGLPKSGTLDLLWQSIVSEGSF